MYLNQIAHYWDTRATGYSNTIHDRLASGERDYYLGMLRSCAPEGEKLRCLDAGCGPGFFSILLAREGHSVTAVDYSEGMLAQARGNFKEMGVNVEAVQGDVQKLPFENGSFDYIVSRDLVWNLEQPELAYREWMRLLKPGGVLFVFDGNHYLYYFDKTYSKAREAGVNIEPHNCYGVDSSPINEIARELPLSRVRRPQWDMETLSSLGMAEISVREESREFTDSESGETETIVFSFAVSARKPAEEEE